jgi:hypothetical protein
MDLFSMLNIFSFFTDPYTSFKTKVIYFSIAVVVVVGIIMIFRLMTSKEKFSSGFFHRSNLASTYWINKPQVQHTFPDLGLQNPDHYDYFRNSCDEKEPNNAELCRYHKHRFDPNQL